MTDLTRITTENNLGISGDAQDALELAGRGIALVGTLLHVIEEEKATVDRLQTLIPHRVQQKRTKGWRMPPNTVSVARPHRWGNPFKVGEHRMVFAELGWGVLTDMPVGPVLDGTICNVVEIADRQVAVDLYRAWLRSATTTAHHPLNLAELAGRNLACFCPLDQPCHADVLLELANPKEQL